MISSSDFRHSVAAQLTAAAPRVSSLTAFVGLVASVTSAFGLPAEAVPMAVLRPLSGSGSFGVMSEILTARGPSLTCGRGPCVARPRNAGPRFR